MSPLRILFMGTPEFAAVALERLLAGPDRVVCVVTRPDRPAGRQRRLQPPPVKRLALAHGLTVMQPSGLGGDAVYDALAATRPDVAVVVAYGRILKPRYLSLPPLGCLNIHASLLPRWRGAAPISWAIVAGDPVTGVTIQQMDEGLDTGPVVRTWSTPIGPLETAGELHDRLAPAGADLIEDVLADVRAGRALHLRPQDEAGATYARLLRKEDGRVDFDRPAAVVANHIRGMTPWPGAVCQTPRGPLKLVRARPLDGTPVAGPPGTVVAADPGQGLRVATAGGTAIEVLACQRPGGQVLAAAEFLRGLHGSMAGEQWGPPPVEGP